jgi:malonyl-CoA O-methyltransferase
MMHELDAEKKLIQRHFNGKASGYESSAVLQRDVGQQMLQRLDYVALKPEVILDLGCGTGVSVKSLMQRYRHARVMAVDISPCMLQQTRKKSGWWRKPALICGDAECLSLADQSVDLVYSNLMLQWCDPGKVFAEILRVLRPEGLLMFSTFGPDTLKELRYSWSQVDEKIHVNQFTDMHILGDELMRAGFASPVMDMDITQLTYQHAYDVMRDLKSIGANTLRQRDHKGLVTQNKLSRVSAAYEKFRQQGVLPASFEIVYGHAWKVARQRKSTTGEIHVAVDQIGRAVKSTGV